MSFVLKLDFRKNESVKNTLVHIDLPNQVMMGNDVSGFLNDRPIADRTQHSIGIGMRNLVLEFLASVPDLRALDCKPSLALFETNADLAAFKSGNQSIAQLPARDRGALPSIVGQQEFALNLDLLRFFFSIAKRPL